MSFPVDFYILFELKVYAWKEQEQCFDMNATKQIMKTYNEPTSDAMSLLSLNAFREQTRLWKRKEKNQLYKLCVFVVVERCRCAG